MDGTTQIAGIDHATLTPIVRRSLGSDTAEVVDWLSCPLKENLIWTTEGILRVSGTAMDQGQPKSWSAVLKVSRGEAAGGDVEAAKRELLAYQSGLLAALPYGLCAPGYLGSAERSDGTLWLWMEEVHDAFGEAWPLSRYGLAARHLGQLNGSYLAGRSLPAEPWLGRDYVRRVREGYKDAYNRYPLVQDQPLARRIWPEDVAERAVRLHQEDGRLLDAMDRLPRTFCHMDAFKRNLIAVRREDGGEETVGLDWGFTGIGALGEELAPMVGAAVALWEYDLSGIRELDEVVFAGYLAGLDDVGWHGDPRLARFGFAASSYLRYCSCWPVSVTDTARAAGLARFFGHPIEEVCDRMAEVIRYWLDLADEAWDPLPIVG